MLLRFQSQIGQEHEVLQWVELNQQKKCKPRGGKNCFHVSAVRSLRHRRSLQGGLWVEEQSVWLSCCLFQVPAMSVTGRTPAAHSRREPPACKAATNTILQASLWTPQASSCFRQCWRLQDLRTVHPRSVGLVSWSGSVDSTHTHKTADLETTWMWFGTWESSSYWWAKKKKTQTKPNTSPLPCNRDGTLQLVTAFHWDLVTVSSVVHVLQASEMELSDTVPTGIWLFNSNFFRQSLCHTQGGHSPAPMNCPPGFVLLWGSWCHAESWGRWWAAPSPALWTQTSRWDSPEKLLFFLFNVVIRDSEVHRTFC